MTKLRSASSYVIVQKAPNPPPLSPFTVISSRSFECTFHAIEGSRSVSACWLWSGMKVTELWQVVSVSPTTTHPPHIQLKEHCLDPPKFPEFECLRCLPLCPFRWLMRTSALRWSMVSLRLVGGASASTGSPCFSPTQQILRSVFHFERGIDKINSLDIDCQLTGHPYDYYWEDYSVNFTAPCYYMYEDYGIYTEHLLLLATAYIVKVNV